MVVNDPIRLECEASGLPVPSLTWLKDGSPVSSFSDGIQVCVFWMMSCVRIRITYYECFFFWFSLFLDTVRWQNIVVCQRTGE